MTDNEKIALRFRAIKLTGLAVMCLTLIVWFIARPWHAVLSGLLIGEVGGACLVYSMIRQGHLKDNLQGGPLMVSGVIGFFTRMVVLVAVVVIALKVPHVNVYAALTGYLLGFVFIAVGMYGYAKNS